MDLSPFLSINQPCDEVLQRIKEKLTQAGLRAVQTFDLYFARIASRECSCPKHGMEDCDCQMVVLLVYGGAADVSTLSDTGPVTLILHGNDGKTRLSIAEYPSQPADGKLIADTRKLLEAVVVKQANDTITISASS